jgi:3-phenylpropionate/trans-cinnamate dioxygenase ferredoxin reductase subunit
MPKERIIVVGAGLAAARAVESARTAGFDGEILLVGEEPRLPYERPPLSKEWLTADTLPQEEPAIFPASSWDDWRVDRALGVCAQALDPRARMLTLAGGRRLRYDRLLIATGARPRQLSVPGVELDGVLTLRTLPDATDLRARLRASQRIVVMGAGLVGLEVAAAARSLGREVTVVEADHAPLRRLIGPQMGGTIAAMHADAGVDLRFVETAAALRGHRRVEEVVLASGVRVAADLVVVGIGVVPDVGWLRGTGLDGPAGVPVDGLTRTPVPGVHAAGDVACAWQPESGIFGRRVETYANAAAQGAAAGRAMAGAPTPYVPSPGGSSTQYGHRLQFVGELVGEEDVVLRGSADERRFVAFYVRGGRVTAAFALDRARDVPTARALVAAGAAVPAEVLADPSASLAPWTTERR